LCKVTNKKAVHNLHIVDAEKQNGVQLISCDIRFMKRDIEQRSDIELLVNSFYDKVKQDIIIGYIFNDVAKVHWEHHLPVMYNFWEGVIFNKNLYDGNPHGGT